MCILIILLKKLQKHFSIKWYYFKGGYIGFYNADMLFLPKQSVVFQYLYCSQLFTMKNNALLSNIYTYI